MRNFAILAALTLSLLALAAPLAHAGAEEDRASRGREKADDGAKALDAKARGRGERADDADKDNETAAKQKRAAFLDGFRAKMAEWRAAWKENAAAIREACHAAAPDPANATKEERKARAHCIRDGYHELFAALKMERKAWQDERKALHE